MADGRWRTADGRTELEDRHLPSAICHPLGHPLVCRIVRGGRIITPFPRRRAPMAMLSTTFTGLKFDNPFLPASAPPTESDANIMRAFEAAWAGVVTNAICLHPLVTGERPSTRL